MKEELLSINGIFYKCELHKRRKSKTIRLKVDNDFIIKVSLPKYVPYLAAKNFVIKNKNWIEKKINLLILQKSQYYYLGKDIRVVKKNIIDSKNLNYYFYNNELTFYTNNSLTKKELYYDWLKDKADEYIRERVKELSKKYNFSYNSVKIKNLKSRWGSCSSKKNLSFNLKLMYFNSYVIDYVIVHELCHLKEMNHSKKFWKLVEEIIPDYKVHRQQLNKIIL